MARFKWVFGTLDGKSHHSKTNEATDEQIDEYKNAMKTVCKTRGSEGAEINMEKGDGTFTVIPFHALAHATLITDR